MDTWSQRQKGLMGLVRCAVLDWLIDPYAGARWGDRLLHAALYSRGADDDHAEHEGADTEDSGQRHDRVSEGMRDCGSGSRLEQEEGEMGMQGSGFVVMLRVRGLI